MAFIPGYILFVIVFLVILIYYLYRVQRTPSIKRCFLLFVLDIKDAIIDIFIDKWKNLKFYLVL